MDERVRAVGRAVAAADTVVALTGAGVSTASGIPDFRGDGGLWERFDPDAFHVWRFEREPDAFWADWLDLHDDAFDGPVEPNPAHRALAALESAGALDAVLTQNVDGLHQAAGTDRVIELHGNGDRVVCQSCGNRRDAGPVLDRARRDDAVLPPECTVCGGVLKPDSVLFGEQLPRHALFEAQWLAERADVFIAAGSSLTVEPAASLPETAADRGGTLVVANAEPTPLADRADYAFRDSVTDVLPRLAAVVDDVA